MKRLRKSFYYAFSGLKQTWQKEQNFRIQLLIGSIIIAAGMIISLDWFRMFALIVTICMVLSLETINSAFERYIDRISPERDDTIGLVKDMLAGAVLLSVLASVIIAGLVFIKPLSVIF
ncbi:MAG: diacylglycerol kinase family protein [Candidatus Colwellbacteria bacterium]|nr:diacylglycerol kinase family protein [Candidatus Colwellbacteria bacterium]